MGSAVSNWCQISDCEPDRSDGNLIVGNVISNTAAESIDIKEGTTGGVVQDNEFDGAGMRADADSWVDVKGNGWVVRDNHGTSARGSGFEVHRLVQGWGTGNVFDGNSADVRGSGYGFELRSHRSEIDVSRRCLEKNVHRLTHQLPGSAHDQRSRHE